MSAEGMIDLLSPHSAVETADRLEHFLQSKGMKIFARIDQEAEAKAAGLNLRPTILLLFGNPTAGTPLMEKYPSLALDLPLKALVWETDGKVYVSYSSPEYLQKRHQLPMIPFAPLPDLLAAALR
jgi:uncharacterized protein (DUF302 family)